LGFATALGPAPLATAVERGVNLASALGCLDPATVVTVATARGGRRRT
jgi:hypothetical protein